jgi:hypothetical protein
MIALTGEQVHAAYNKALQDRNRTRTSMSMVEPLRLWREIQPSEQKFFDGMAAYLNVLRAEQEAQA